MAQIFTNGQGYDQFNPMKKKGDASAALMSFIQDSGIPQIVVSDGAEETIHGEFERICQMDKTRADSPLQSLVKPGRGVGA